jgi:hypothetical protein
MTTTDQFALNQCKRSEAKLIKRMSAATPAPNTSMPR